MKEGKRTLSSSFSQEKIFLSCFSETLQPRVQVSGHCSSSACDPDGRWRNSASGAGREHTPRAAEALAPASASRSLEDASRGCLAYIHPPVPRQDPQPQDPPRRHRLSARSSQSACFKPKGSKTLKCIGKNASMLHFTLLPVEGIMFSMFDTVVNSSENT